MKPRAMTNLTKMVKRRGMRLMLLSTQRRFHSLLWFFFITMARRNGAMMMMVRRPVMALAYQCNRQPGKRLRMNGRTNVNIRVMTAAERMEYATVLMVICLSRDFHLLCWVVDGWLMAKWLSTLMSLSGRCFSITR